LSYNTGVINNAAPAATLMSTVQSLIDAHPAWVFIEQVVGSTATNVTDVYKCLGTLNSFGTDFYVGFTRSGATAGTAKCGFIIGETYDSSAKTFGKGAPYCSNATALTVAADFSYGTARHVANETSAVALTDGFLRAASLSGSYAGTAPGSASTNFTWQLSVTNDRIILVTYATTAVVFSGYAGLYDSFHSIAVDPFPLIATAAMSSEQGSSGQADQRLAASFSGGACTRDAAVAGSITGAFRSAVSGHPWTWVRGSQNTQWSSSTVSKEPMSGKWWPSRIVVYPESRIGAVKGLLKPDLLMADMAEIGEVLGDLITIDGTQYVCVSVHSGVGEMTNSSTSGTVRPTSYWLSQAA
jgi:hypothetical protein